MQFCLPDAELLTRKQDTGEVIFSVIILVDLSSKSSVDVQS
jgi:hypothetical protein